jgi:hypothetical protein
VGVLCCVLHLCVHSVCVRAQCVCACTVCVCAVCVRVHWEGPGPAPFNRLDTAMYPVRGSDAEVTMLHCNGTTGRGGGQGQAGTGSTSLVREGPNHCTHHNIHGDVSVLSSLEGSVVLVVLDHTL